MQNKIKEVNIPGKIDVFSEYVKIKRATAKLMKAVQASQEFNIATYGTNLDNFNKELDSAYRDALGEEFESLDQMYNKIERSM